LSATEQKRIGIGMLVMAWLVFMGLLGFYFQDVLDDQRNPNQQIVTDYHAGGVREVVLQRNKFGHYVTAGTINGERVVFMLDTGATGVAIPEATAERLGLKRGRSYATQTANGIGKAYATELERISVGDISLTNIPAAIAPGLQTDEILLGMSFLKHIEFAQRGDSLILRQYPAT